MDNIVNLRLLSNPWNWLAIGAMLVLVYMAALVVYSNMNAPETAANLAPEN